LPSTTVRAKKGAHFEPALIQINFFYRPEDLSDVDVENWPKDVIAGRDPQLERAVQEAIRLLKERSVDRLSKEPAPPTWGKRP
jgi:hypothetical protein